MVCPKCGSEKNQIYTETKGKIKGRGCLSTIFHLIMILCTAGLWLIVPLLLGSNKGKITTDVNFICLECGTKFTPIGKIIK